MHRINLTENVMNDVNTETSTKEQVAFDLMTTIAHASCSSKGKFKRKQKSEEYWLDLYEKCLLSVLKIRPKPLEKSLGTPLKAPTIAKQNATAFSN
jgi:hypothetical protein